MLSEEQIEDIEYNLFVEGPTFTNSQFGGHPFYDWNIKEAIKNGQMILEEEKVVLTTPFNPYDYVEKSLFDQYWQEKNKNNVIKYYEGNEGFTTTLIYENEKWVIIDKGDYETLLEENDNI